MGIWGQASSLKGKTALITGASSGVGRATSLLLAREGARVVATARRADRLAELVQEIEASGGSAIAVPGDATDRATAATAVTQCMETFGRLDILVNNAGQGAYKQLVDTSIEEYDTLMDSNMKSSFLFSREVVPHFIAQRSGTIVFVSSVAGLRGTGNEAVYSASKFAQVGFAQALDDELRPFGIKVCALCPGGIKTEFAIGKGRTAEGVATSTMMDPSEVADSIAFVCVQPPNVRILQTVVRNMGEQK